VIELAILANNVEILNKREFGKEQVKAETVKEFQVFWRQ